MFIEHLARFIVKDSHFATSGKIEPQNMEIYNQYGQYQRYRQMSLDDMLLENRIDCISPYFGVPFCRKSQNGNRLQ